MFDESSVLTNIDQFDQKLIQASRDEDVDSDEDIFTIGREYCFRDLRSVK